jgi:zinc protease
MLAPPRSTPDFYVLEVLNSVLGGGFSGRLNLNLREDKGYTYGAFSSIRYGIRQSLFLSSAPVESSVTKEAIAEMLSELEALRTWARPVSDDELNHAKENLVRGFAQRFESVSQVAGEIAELEGFGLESGELRRYSDEVQSVGLRDLESAASEHFATDRSILVVVGDGSRILDGVESIAFGPLVRLDADGEPV